MHEAGLSSLAVAFPPRVVTNAHWQMHYPEMVSNLERLALGRTWSTSQGNPFTQKFDAAMAPFVSDPFRGCQQRRWFEPGENALALEASTARAALDAAKLRPSDIDLCIVGAFPPAHINVGDAAYLASALDLRCPAWNLEATCASTLIAMQVAWSTVRAGHARNVLIVNACVYSQAAPAEEVVSLANGDGVSAMVVSRKEVPGILGYYTVNTAQTCDALTYELDRDASGNPAIRMRLGSQAGRMIRESTEKTFLECVAGALSAAELTLKDIDFFSFNASAAWLVPLYIDLLGVDARKTVDTHRWFANTGPVLVPTGVFYGAHQGKIPNGGHVLCFGIGNTSNASALVFRWNNVGLAPAQALL
jgi:3-oxoacyl-[acyl-carrier-protein] synthase III